MTEMSAPPTNQLTARRGEDPEGTPALDDAGSGHSFFPCQFEVERVPWFGRPSALLLLLAALCLAFVWLNGDWRDIGRSALVLGMGTVLRIPSRILRDVRVRRRVYRVISSTCKLGLYRLPERLGAKDPYARCVNYRNMAHVAGVQHAIFAPMSVREYTVAMAPESSEGFENPPGRSDNPLSGLTGVTCTYRGYVVSVDVLVAAEDEDSTEIRIDAGLPEASHTTDEKELETRGPPAWMSPAARSALSRLAHTLPPVHDIELCAGHLTCSVRAADPEPPRLEQLERRIVEMIDLADAVRA
jgi:hypothetical protein